MADAGYSRTPLARKLNLRDGQSVAFEGMPASVREEIAAAGLSLEHCAPYDAALDALIVFATDAEALAERLAAARGQITPAGFVWVCWPKKASRMPTTITEDRIRDIALPLGLVDTKVCAVDTVWSGLKLFIRKDLRSG